MQKIKRLSVFCGSNSGNNPIFKTSARELGYSLCSANIGLVYGGAKVGIMGEIANAVLSRQGEVIGVIPRDLVEKEIAHHDITQLHIVNSLHERKALISELADGFILLPGATGSLDEFNEIITWAQLGLHTKPCGILNIANYYDHFLKFLDHAVEMDFLKPVFREMIIVEERPDKLLEAFACYQAPVDIKWIKSIKEA